MKELLHLHIYLYSSRGKSHPITAVSGGLAVSKILHGDGVQCYPLRRGGDMTGRRVQGEFTRDTQVTGTQQMVWST